MVRGYAESSHEILASTLELQSFLLVNFTCNRACFLPEIRNSCQHLLSWRVCQCARRRERQYGRLSKRTIVDSPLSQPATRRGHRPSCQISALAERARGN